MAPRRKRPRKKKKKKNRQRGGLLPGFGLAKGLTRLSAMGVKNKGAKQALTESLGAKLKRAWDNITGKNRRRLKGVAYNMKNGKLPKKPKGCKVLTHAKDGKGRIISYSCFR